MASLKDVGKTIGRGLKAVHEFRKAERESKADYIKAKTEANKTKWKFKSDRMRIRRSTANIAAAGTAVAGAIGAARTPTVQSNLDAWNAINNQNATPAPNTGGPSNKNAPQPKSTGDPGTHTSYYNYGED